MTRPAVYATGVGVTLGHHRVLDDVDLTVGNGDWVTIIGPNGAGKSTLLRALTGLVPSSGRIELFGTSLATISRREIAQRVAYVAQQSTLPAAMTVAHYVLLGRTPHLAPLASESDHDLRVAADAIATLGLDGLASRPLGMLSGGERQRVVLARALAQEPTLLLLDEPTAALDIGHQQEVLELVDELRHRRGLTVLATMHDLTLAAQFGDHMVLVADGGVAASGSPVQVLTGDELARHYRARVEVLSHRGVLVVVPTRRTTPIAPATRPVANTPRSPAHQPHPTREPSASDRRGLVGRPGVTELSNLTHQPDPAQPPHEEARNA